MKIADSEHHATKDAIDIKLPAIKKNNLTCLLD
jgi:hypothetical protein